MNGLITLLALLIGLFVLAFVPTLAAPYAAIYGPVTVYDCARALVLCFLVAASAALIIRRDRDHGSYILKLFALALLIRIVVGTAIFVFNGQDFFGGDALTYDFYGYQQLQSWGGDKYAQLLVNQFVGPSMSSGWGMVYLVAALYGIVGRNMLAVQYFNAVIGAATAPIIYLCAWEVFNNRRVARLSAIAVAFYPSLVLWSSQGLKDGPIVFSLALCILATLKLGKKFNATHFGILVGGLFSVMALRFYVFYMILVAVGGAFIIGMRAVTAQSVARQAIIMMFLGLSLTYLGITRYANMQFEQYGTLESIQRSRLDASTSASSGFGKDVDV